MTDAAIPKISMRGVRKAFGDNVVLDGIDLDVGKGEVITLIGASGSGKSTLLRCTNLLEPIDDGALLLDGVDIAEPGLDADPIRDEKVKVLQALRPVTPEQVLESTVRAQYAAGVVDGERVPGYLEEPDVAPDSRTETYVAARLFVDNWRWAGVPFYLRSGKRLPKRVSEIALRFRDVPHRLFDGPVATNTLALRIQPDEGITLKFASKVPGPKPRIQPVNMEFRYGTSFGHGPPEAYERLILDAILGDSTLFIRRDEVEASWSYIDALMDGWNTNPAALPGYAAGSWGPDEADALLENSGRAWRRL
jgi:glucose-6-phosphate 1-dehydrogenase